MQNALKVFINNLGVVICQRSKAQLYKVGADEQIIMLVDEVQGSTTIIEVSSLIYIHLRNDVGLLPFIASDVVSLLSRFS